MKSTMVIVSTLLFLALIGANLFAGKWFFTQAIPSARIALQARLGVDIETSISGVWSSVSRSTDANSKWWHAFAIPGCHFLLMVFFLTFVLSQLLVVFLVAQRIGR